MGHRTRRGLLGATMLLVVAGYFAWPVQAAPAARGTSTTTATSADPAVSFQIDPAHSGGQPADSLASPLVKQWSLDLKGAVSYPLIANNRAYVTVDGGAGGGPRLFALDLKTGTSLWGPVDLGSSTAAAAYDNGKLLTVNGSGMMQALDASTGQTLWFRSLSDSVTSGLNTAQYMFSSPPTALNGIVYTSGSGGGGTLYAVNESDGSLRWTQPVVNGDSSAPVVTSNAVYVSYACQWAAAFNPQNGSPLWTHTTGCSGGGGATSVLSGGKLYVRDIVSGNIVLDAGSGNPLGSFSADAPPAFDSAQGYFLHQKTLTAEDSNQVVHGNFAGDGGLDTPPVVSNGTIYEGSSSGNLYALDPTLQPLQTINVGAPITAFRDGLSMAGLAVGDGSLLVPAGTQLVAYSNATPGPGPSPTPMPGVNLQAPTGGLSQQVATQVDAAHTGLQPADSTAPPLARAWSRDFPSGVSYPVIADGKAYVTAGTLLHAINMQSSSGADAWAVDVGGNAWLAYADSRVFALTTSGLLKAINSTTAAPLWSIQLPNQWSFSSPPTVANGIVYTGGAGSGGTVYAVNEWTGALLWTGSVMNGDDSSPAVSSDGVFVSYACRQTYAFNPQQGTTLWHSSGPCEGGGGATPSLYQGRLYVRDGDGNLVYDARSGAALRSFAATALPAFDGSLAFFLSGSTLQAEDVSTGFIRWTFNGDGGLVTAPIVVNGYVYVGSSSGTLFAVSAAGGQQAWSDAAGVAYTGSNSNGATGLGAAEGMVVAVAGTRVVGYGTHVTPVPTSTPIPPTPPSAPTGVQAVADYSSARVSWTAPASGTYPITGYAVTPHFGSNSLAPTTVSGSPPATSTVVTGLSNGTFYTFTVTATSRAGTGPPSAPSNPVRPMLGGSYHPLSPARILDTRTGIGSPSSPLASNSSRTVQVAGKGGVPLTGASAAVINVTVTNPTAPGYLTVYPSDAASRPLASNLNWVARQTVPNLVEVALSARGQVDIYGLGSSEDVIFDVQGWVGLPSNSTGQDGLYNALTPARILDTRDGTGTGGSTRPLGAGQPLTLQVAGSLRHDGVPSGVPPAGVSAVVLNVTITNPSAAGYLTVYPADASRPVASNLNFVPGQTVPNRVVVKLSRTGQVTIYNPAGNVHVIADVNGWFTDSTSATGGSSFGGVTPARFFDSRDPNSGGPIPGGYVLPLQVVDQNNNPASDITAVVFNVTATDGTAPSYLTLWPDSGPQSAPPTASDLNFVAHQTVPNLVVVQLGNNATFDVYNAAGDTDVVLDLVGVYGTRNAATPSNTLHLYSRARFRALPAPAGASPTGARS